VLGIDFGGTSVMAGVVLGDHVVAAMALDETKQRRFPECSEPWPGWIALGCG